MLQVLFFLRGFYGGVRPVSIATLKQDILQHVSTTARAGGIVRNCLIVPNTIPQYSDIKTLLDNLGSLPIFRAINLAHLPIDANSIIADHKAQTTATAYPVQAPPRGLGLAVIG